MQDERDYRIAAAEALELAQQSTDTELADAYRQLAQSYLALARFHERIVPKLPATHSIEHGR
jgi:hypothetical protein